MTILDKLPKRMQKPVRSQLYKIYQAPTRRECEAMRDELLDRLGVRSNTQPRRRNYSVIGRTWSASATCRPSIGVIWAPPTPIESVFAGVRLRSDVTKRSGNRENAVYSVFKLIQRLSRNWYALNSTCVVNPLRHATATGESTTVDSIPE
jgi:transposase-like protein